MNYTKKPITIQALQFKGTWDSLAEITGKFSDLEQDGMFLEEDKTTVPWFGIKTLEGTMKCTKDDYVIRGIKGEYYPCKADIFKASYNKESLVGAINKIPSEIRRGLNALRLEVHEDIVNSLIELVERELSSIEIMNYDGNVPVKMNGFPVGHWQMFSVRDNLLVEPIFVPVGGFPAMDGSGE